MLDERQIQIRSIKRTSTFIGSFVIDGHATLTVVPSGKMNAGTCSYG
jgi:hypothetical protein